MSLPTLQEPLILSAYMVWMEDYIRRVIWTCQGTYDETTLDALVKSHDNLARINLEDELRQDQIRYVVKTVRRFNLALKVDAQGGALDLQDKEVCARLAEYGPHPELEQELPVTLLDPHSPHPLTGVGTEFMFQDDAHRRVLWTYTRVLWQMSQMLLLKETTPPPGLTQLIGELEELVAESGMDPLMASDPYLKHGLFDKDAALGAKSLAKIEEAFVRHNIGPNDPLREVVLKITHEIRDRRGFTEGLGDLKNSTIDIAKSVVGSLKKSGNQARPSRQNMRKLTVILQEILSDSEIEISPEIRKLVTAVQDEMESDAPMTKERMTEVAHKAGITPGQLSSYMTSLVGNATKGSG